MVKVQCELDAKYAVISFVETLSMDNMQAFSKNTQVGYSHVRPLFPALLDQISLGNPLQGLPLAAACG